MNTLPFNGDLETRVRDVLARQASALQPPDVRPDDAVVVARGSADQRKRGPQQRILLAAAAVGLVVSAALAIANHGADDGVEPGSQPAAGFHFATPQVSFDAGSVEVEAGGRTFVPPASTSVNGDPGTWNEHTTLELEWDAEGVPMRIYIYFASDGHDWWATELRTYDLSPDKDWIEMPGEYFRSPLGVPWQGDLDVQSLHIRDLKLQAFVRPSVCESPTKPRALVSNFGAIESQAGGGYGATVTLIDTAVCAPVPVDGVNVAITSGDNDVARVEPMLLPEGFGMPTGVIRVDLVLPSPGTTNVHVAVSDTSTNELIDQVDIPVIVNAPDGAQPSPTTLPPTAST